MIGREAGPVEADVVVVGGGAAGAIAALAARAGGRSVALVRRAWGSTAVSSGAADVAPDPTGSPANPRGERRSVSACAEALAIRRPDHPYAVLRRRLPELGEALAFAAKELDGLLSFEAPAAENRYLVSPLGALKATAGGLASTAAGDVVRGGGTVGIVGFGHHPLVDAVLVAAGVDDATRRGALATRAVPVRVAFLDGRGDAELFPHELAGRLAEPGAVEALAAAVKLALPAGVTRLVFPPALSETDARPVLARLQQALGLPCAEALAAPPSLPGLRLQRALEARLVSAGVELVAGEAVAPGGPGTELQVRSAEPPVAHPSRYDEGIPTREHAPPPGHPVRAKAVVLATGKFLGGGIRRRGRLCESVFDLPVHLAPGVDPARWLGDFTSYELGEEQAAFRAGVRIDDRLRPLRADGSVASERLFACGALLAGNDAARDGAGLGLCILTGWLAGREAASVSGS